MAERLVRCIEGHIYDASHHQTCPSCGARPPLGVDMGSSLVAEVPKAASLSAALPQAKIKLWGGIAAAVLAVALVASPWRITDVRGWLDEMMGQLSAPSISERENRTAPQNSDPEFDPRVRELSDAIRRTPQDPNLFMLRGDAYTVLKAFDAAIADYEQAIKLKVNDPVAKQQAEPRNIDLLRKQTMAYLFKGDTANAVTRLRMVYALDPSDSKVKATLDDLQSTLDRKAARSTPKGGR